MGLRSRFKTKRQLTGACQYKAWEKWSEGNFMIGRYQGIKTSNYGDNYKFMLLDTDMKDLKLDMSFVLNSNGLLDKAMQEVSENDLVKVTYKGKSTLTKGPFAGKAAHNVEVEILEEDNSEEDIEL